MVLTPHFKRKGGVNMKLVIGMTGATGAIFGIRLLEYLKAAEIETHLVVSPWANVTITHETDYTLKDVRNSHPIRILTKTRRRRFQAVRLKRTG